MFEEPSEASGEFASVANEFREFRSQMKNPLVVGALLNRLAEEKRSTNLLLKQIHEKLDRLLELEERISSLEQKISRKNIPVAQPASQAPLQMLSATDEKIMLFVKQRERTCAEELQKHFNYRGRNAASSRLNALWKQGLLDKKYAGKVVYFTPKTG